MDKRLHEGGKKMEKIALQLYSVYEECGKDFPGVLQKVAKMGYDGVEFAGYYNLSANELKKILDDLGLKAAGTHILIDTLLGDEFKKTVEFNQVIGNKYLIVPGLPEERISSRAAWLENAKLFSELAEKLKAYNMYVGYHSHAGDFKPLDGEWPWDTFYGNASKDVVMQLDMGNSMAGGVSSQGLVDILKKYPGRARTVHMKEFSATNEKAIVGEGDVKWKEIIAACREQGVTDWYVIEQESHAYPPMECVERCLQNLKKLV